MNMQIHAQDALRRNIVDVAIVFQCGSSDCKKLLIEFEASCDARVDRDAKSEVAWEVVQQHSSHTVVAIGVAVIDIGDPLLKLSLRRNTFSWTWRGRKSIEA